MTAARRPRTRVCCRGRRRRPSGARRGGPTSLHDPVGPWQLAAQARQPRRHRRVRDVRGEPGERGDEHEAAPSTEALEVAEPQRQRDRERDDEVAEVDDPRREIPPTRIVGIPELLLQRDRRHRPEHGLVEAELRLHVRHRRLALTDPVQRGVGDWDGRVRQPLPRPSSLPCPRVDDSSVVNVRGPTNSLRYPRPVMRVPPCG